MVKAMIALGFTQSCEALYCVSKVDVRYSPVEVGPRGITIYHGVPNAISSADICP